MAHGTGRPLVSVIIPNYNYAKYISATISSVLAQTYSNTEIIVVDDGSVDSSVEIIESFSKRISLFVTSNKGACHARNFGTLKSRGEFIAYLDADDVWLPQKLETQIKVIMKENSDVVYSDYSLFEEHSEIATQIDSMKEVSHNLFWIKPSSTPIIPSTALIRRDFFAMVGGWNTSLNSPSEDFDFFRKCIKFGKVSYVKDYSTLKRVHKTSLSAKDFNRYFQDNVQAVRIMLAEDSSKLTFVNRLFIWNRLHAVYLKQILKGQKFRSLKLWLFSYLKI